jgi:hypothetical protein
MRPLASARHKILGFRRRGRPKQPPLKLFKPMQYNNLFAARQLLTLAPAAASVSFAARRRHSA